jgi:hypothetical protein
MLILHKKGMHTHLALTDLAFEEQFARHEISPSIFSHEAHLRLAYIHIEKYGIALAVENICAQLKSFVAFLGVPEKYNETVTIAAIKMVYHFRSKSTANNFQDFIRENPRLKNNFHDLLSQHYTVDIFTAEKAKKMFLIPDLEQFD